MHDELKFRYKNKPTNTLAYMWQKYELGYKKIRQYTCRRKYELRYKNKHTNTPVYMQEKTRKRYTKTNTKIHQY